MNNSLDTQEMKRLQFSVAETRTAHCPTCDDQSTFTWHGIQTWPKKVADAMGLPETMSVWQCQKCDTTLLEPNLTFDE